MGVHQFNHQIVIQSNFICLYNIHNARRCTAHSYLAKKAAIHHARASFGKRSRWSLPCRPTSSPGSVFLPSSSPDTRALLTAVAGCLKALLPSPEIGPSTPPVPTLMPLESEDCQSLGTGGWSGKGRFDLFSSISLRLSTLRSI